VEGSCVNLIVIGQVDLVVGHWESAQQNFDEALAAAREVSSAGLEALLLSHLAVLALETGDHATALRNARASAARAPDAPSPVDRAYCQAALGHACLAVGDDAGAEATFRASRGEYASTERPQVVYEPEVGLAEVARRRGDLGTAVELVGPLVEAAVTGPALDLIECSQPAALLVIARGVLDATGDPRSDAFVRAAAAYLLDRARAIGDEEMAAGYLAKKSEAEVLRLAGAEPDPGNGILAVDGGPG
jgi:ATP/maltotriose-dependent transcriptional regulator MalT